MDPVPIIQVMEVEEDRVASGGLGVAEAATALPAEVVRAEYAEAAGGAVDRPGYVRGEPQLSSGVRRRGARRSAEARDGDPPPGEDEPSFRCPVCAGRTSPHPVRMARHLRHAHQPDDYAGMDLTAFGCAACPTCSHAFASGAELTSHHGRCRALDQGGGGDAGSQAGGGTTANRAQRREQLVDPVIPEASWEWLRSLPLEEVFACPFSTARHVPKRAKNAFAEAMRWVLRSLSGDNEDFWRLLGVASMLLLAPQPGARRKSIPAELIRERVRRMLAGDWEALFRAAAPSAPVWPARTSEERVANDVFSLVKEGQLAKAIGRLDPGVLAPLQPETLEALAELHLAGEGLPAQVQAAPLVLEEAAVEAECRRLPVASGPGCSPLSFGSSISVLSLELGTGFMPSSMCVNSWCPTGCRRGSCRGSWGRGLWRSSSQAVEFGGDDCVRGDPKKTRGQVQALLGAVPTWCALQLDCKNAFNTVHRRAIFQAVYEDFPELLGLTESCFRHETRLGWRGADGTFHWISSAEGAQQGDPLGPFFMAAPLQPVLQAALRAHPDVYIIAYLDDIHILGEPDRARAAYDTIVPLLEGIGLDLNVGKSAIFSPSGAVGAFRDVVDSTGRSMPGAVEPLEGIKVLGVPIGSDAWVADKCFEIATKAGSILPKLARLNDPQVQLLLLRYCAHPRFMHLVRVVQPHLLMQQGALEHDAGIQRCLQEVTGSPYPLGEEAVAISQLPTRWGGLGLTSAQRLAPAGWLGSWANAWKKMVVMFPAVRDLLPHLGAPEGTDFGGHPLVAGLAAAMEDVRGAKARVLAAEREEHPVPEGLQIPAEAPGWEGFGDDRPASQKELTIY
ncbi:hypothetical protein CYMTET_17246 [Cymbomonas tetramitiformis]|uniref:Reverse transcriptase domain-containing protein n=1 Tax=Cymbomonas tetramitiformis TaxID=36881 RepID=A0AAE0L751_9CHLO|nr:hypothetical protein CYMTET_17246 [Cymbomonas tetramitiformis]